MCVCVWGGGGSNAYGGFSRGNAKERVRLKNVVIDGNMILKRMLKK
jgi:hypothetical protein